MDDYIITQLECQIEALIDLCENLNAENRTLRERHFQWLNEKSELIKKNEIAASKIESMINRLKSLEHNE